MKDFSVEIELLKNINMQDSPLQIPKNNLKKGTIQEDDVRVYIQEYVNTQIEELACSDTKKRTGQYSAGKSGAAQRENPCDHICFY